MGRPHYYYLLLSLNKQKNILFNFSLNESKTVNVTPSTPYFYLYEFQSEEVNSILLHVTSDDDTCMIVSIQNVSCPIFDLEENVQYRGHFQTITRQGGLTLTVCIQYFTLNIYLYYWKIIFFVKLYFFREMLFRMVFI